MSDYIYQVSPYHQQLIKNAISICNSLNVPIAGNFTFEYFDDRRAVGLCNPETKTIYINERLSEKDFIETAIHELLHTIDNKSYSAHRGIWKKWANFISQNSDYFINDNYGAETVAIYPPNTVLPQMTKSDRHRYIQKVLKSNRFSLDDLLSFLPYADKADTGTIIEIILLNYPLKNLKLQILLKNSIQSDSVLSCRLAHDYCKERFAKTINTPESRYLFDFLFSADNFMKVSAHTNEILKRLG